MGPYPAVKDADIIAFANLRMGFIQRARGHLPLSREDWEDWRQETLIAIFKRRDLFAFYPMKGLICTMIRFCWGNLMRGVCGRGMRSTKSHQLYLNLRWAQPLITRVEHEDMEDEVVWEPDMPAPTPAPRLAATLEVLDSMPERERETLRLYVELGTCHEAAKVLGVSRQRVHQIVIKARHILHERLSQDQFVAARTLAA